MLGKLIGWFSTILINIGGSGTEQMCVGFLHEVEIPEELKELD